MLLRIGLTAGWGGADLAKSLLFALSNDSFFTLAVLGEFPRSPMSGPSFTAAASSPSTSEEVSSVLVAFELAFAMASFGLTFAFIDREKFSRATISGDYSTELS